MNALLSHAVANLYAITVWISTHVIVPLDGKAVATTNSVEVRACINYTAISHHLHIFDATKHVFYHQTSMSVKIYSAEESYLAVLTA